MKKGLLAIGALFAICLSMLATDMVVKQKNGEDWKINVDDVEEVFFEENAIIPEDSTVVDASETFLLFNILSDSTVELTRETPNLKEDSYFGHDSIIVPQKIRIDGKIYTVTSIGENAFYGCGGLTNIEIPKSVTNIGTWAFSYCSNLEPKLLVYDKGTKCYGWIGDKEKCTEVVIPESVTSIGEKAFFECDNLTSIIIPESVISIGSLAFDRCNNLEPKLLIYDKGTKCYGWIGNKEKCTNVVIPEGVTSIGESAFRECSSLTSIKIPESVISIEIAAFLGCSSLASINIPEGVTSIGGYAFVGCSGLTSIEIPDGVTYIGGYTFKNCSNLTSINIPVGVTSIEGCAFQYCNSLKNINIPEGVTSIGELAFEGCSNLNVTIDNSKENIKLGSNAFRNCKSVKWLKD